jgi:dipeptidyl aminopeptidase/acylaminoacyl peptidase
MEDLPFERFTAARRYLGLSFLRDPNWTAYISDTSGQLNLWLTASHLTEAGLPAEPEQLTIFTDYSVRSVYASPANDDLVFFADPNGTENFQIFVMNAFSGWPRPVSFDERVRHDFGAECFSPDGRFIAYSSNERSHEDMLLYAMNLHDNAKITLTNTHGWFQMGYWAPDSRRLSAVELVTVTQASVWVCDVADGSARRVTPVYEKTRFIPGPWSSDGRGFYVLTDKDREYIGLAFYDLDKGALNWVETPEWDVESVALSRDGRLLVWSVNENGMSRVYLRELSTDRRSRLALPDGVVSSIAVSGRGELVGLVLSTYYSLGDIWVYGSAEGKLEKVGHSMIGRIPQDQFVKPSPIRVKSFDGLEIPTWVYRPSVTGSRRPVILSIHGGPGSQERPGYAYVGLYQYWLSRGIAVVAPNFRGSTGYGKSYERKIMHDWGGGELRDFESIAKWLVSQDWVDPSRMGVFGGSFGGFATLSCVTRLAHYWKAAVDIVGPSNLVTFANSVPAHWKRMLAEWVGEPEKEADFLRERSPISYVENVRADLLVIQGANDPRVSKAESEQMVEKLRAMGRKVEYMLFEDEGHGFTKRSNMLKAFKATAEFLERSLNE